MSLSLTSARSSAGGVVAGVLLSAAFAPVTLCFGQSEGAEKYVLGWTSTDSIYQAMPTIRPDEERYAPDSAAMAELKQWPSPVAISVFFGSWCSDTKRELPRFLAVLHSAGNPAFRVRYLGLDRTKQDSAGIAVRHDISHVPTFIFFRNGDELGRIVEEPASPIEQEWLDILRNDHWPRLGKELWRVLCDALVATALRSTTIF